MFSFLILYILFTPDNLNILSSQCLCLQNLTLVGIDDSFNRWNHEFIVIDHIV